MIQIIFLIAFISATFAFPSSDNKALWQDFKITHIKNYENEQEDKLRFQIFSDNLDKIKQHNELYEAGLVSYRMGVNKFADLTTEEFQQFLGYSAQHSKPGTNRAVFGSPVGGNLPESIDYRDKKAVNPIKDQGQCGSCWAFSTTGSLESLYFLKNGKLLSFSEQNLVDCSNSYGNYGCNGGLMDSAFEYIEDKGIESESAYPYTARDGNCVYNATKVAAKIKSFVDIEAGSEAALQAAVATVGPVSVAVDASSFQSYSGGILETTGPYYLNHGVVAIGYGVEKGVEFWLVRNSWGASWGEEGYIRIARNKNNQVGITDNASYPVL